MVKQPLVANQLQFGLKHTEMIDQELQVNMTSKGSYDHDGGILLYSRLHEMTIQAWSPYQYGFFEGVFIGNEKFPELNQAMDEMAEKIRHYANWFSECLDFKSSSEYASYRWYYDTISFRRNCQSE